MKQTRRRGERETYHATCIIKKTSKLNFIKVFKTLQIKVAKNSLPDKNSRARREHRPWLLRKPGKLQEILWSEIHGNLETFKQVDILLLVWLLLLVLRRKLTSNTTSIGRSINPFNYPQLLPDPLVRYVLLIAGARSFGCTMTRKRSIL